MCKIYQLILAFLTKINSELKQIWTYERTIYGQQKLAIKLYSLKSSCMFLCMILLSINNANLHSFYTIKNTNLRYISSILWIAINENPTMKFNTLRKPKEHDTLQERNMVKRRNKITLSSPWMVQDRTHFYFYSCRLTLSPKLLCFLCNLNIARCEKLI